MQYIFPLPKWYHHFKIYYSTTDKIHDETIQCVVLAPQSSVPREQKSIIGNEVWTSCIDFPPVELVSLQFNITVVGPYSVLSFSIYELLALTTKFKNAFVFSSVASKCRANNSNNESLCCHSFWILITCKRVGAYQRFGERGVLCPSEDAGIYRRLHTLSKLKEHCYSHHRENLKSHTMDH